MLKQLIRKIGPNPLDYTLRRARAQNKKKILLFWNRGLGDIALGLYAIKHRILEIIPEAEITFLTRAGLKDGFTLLGGVKTLSHPTLKRGDRPPLKTLLHNLGYDLKDFDLVIENPDPTHWVRWQLGALTPKLIWQKEWDNLAGRFNLDPKARYVGAHVQTETGYASWRDWPLTHWRSLFEKASASGQKVLLFGFAKDKHFEGIDGVVDLRGETTLFELLSIIKDRVKTLIVPDSGISSMVYYLNTSFPIKQITLWGEPQMGILKQNVDSPNPELTHIPLLGSERNIANITPEMVYEHVR